MEILKNTKINFINIKNFKKKIITQRQIKIRRNKKNISQNK